MLTLKVKALKFSISVCVALLIMAISEMRFFYIFIHIKYYWLLGISFIYIYEILNTNQTIKWTLSATFYKENNAKVRPKLMSSMKLTISICSYFNSQQKNVFQNWKLIILV